MHSNKFIFVAFDFNINFADKKSKRLKTILSNKLNLKMNKFSHESTIKYGTIIDVAFFRYLEDVSYFCYHKYVISKLKIPE